jgi:hypothetical protein
MRFLDQGQPGILPDVVSGHLVEGRPEVAGAIDGICHARHCHGGRKRGVDVQLLVVFLVVQKSHLDFPSHLLTEI